MAPTILRTIVTTSTGSTQLEVTTYAELCALTGETAPFEGLGRDEREIVEDLLDRWHEVKCALASMAAEAATRVRSVCQQDEFIERLDALEIVIAAARRGR